MRVGILSGTARAFGHAMLECILDRFPAVHVDVREGEIETLLLELKNQQVDMLLTSVSVYGHGQGEFLNHLVGKVPVVFAAAPEIARRYRRIPRDLKTAPFILPSKPSHIHDQILDRLAEWEIEPRTIVEVQDSELARHLAISGRGVAPLNSYSVSLTAPAKALTIVGRKKMLGLFESVYLVSRKRKWLNPVAAHLLKNFRLPVRAK